MSRSENKNRCVRFKAWISPPILRKSAVSTAERGDPELTADFADFRRLKKGGRKLRPPRSVRLDPHPCRDAAARTCSRQFTGNGTNGPSQRSTSVFSSSLAAQSASTSLSRYSSFELAPSDFIRWLIHLLKPVV